MLSARKSTAILAFLVALNIVLVAILYSRSSVRPPDPLAPREGFSPGQIHSPLIPVGDPNQWEARPEAQNGLFRQRPGYSLSTRWEIDPPFARWGGELLFWVKNEGPSKVFVYSFGMEGDWSAPACASVGISIVPGEEKYLGLLHFPGPENPGMHTLNMKVGMMVYHQTPGPFPAWAWYDYGPVSAGSRSIEFAPVGGTPHFEERRNPAYYFDRANQLMDPQDPAVQGKAAELRSRFPGAWNLYQAAAAFDLVHKNISYHKEPEGTDYWQSPAETLRIGRGDCEDFALLLSALAAALDGTARFHMETEHAFLSIYAGTDLGAAKGALESYYNTDLEVAAFQDRYGYWLSADPTDSMCLGALPLGGQPLAPDWGLTNTTYHYVIDMIP